MLSSLNHQFRYIKNTNNSKIIQVKKNTKKTPPLPNFFLHVTGNSIFLLGLIFYLLFSESTHEILTKFSLFLAFFSARWRPKNFKTTGLFKLHQNTQFLKIWWESVG